MDLLELAHLFNISSRHRFLHGQLWECGLSISTPSSLKLSASHTRRNFPRILYNDVVSMVSYSRCIRRFLKFHCCIQTTRCVPCEDARNSSRGSRIFKNCRLVKLGHIPYEAPQQPNAKTCTIVPRLDRSKLRHKFCNKLTHRLPYSSHPVAFSPDSGV
jgi:hypothetical protein